MEHVAPAWADLIEGICSISNSMTVSSPEEVYRYCYTAWEYMPSTCMKLHQALLTWHIIVSLDVPASTKRWSSLGHAQLLEARINTLAHDWLMSNKCTTSR